MRVVVLLVFGLYFAAHFVPAYRRQVPPHDPVDWFGWEISYLVVDSLVTQPAFTITRETYLIVWLANPLFCLGVAALLVGAAKHRRLAGVVASLAGIGALSCLVAYELTARPFSSYYRLTLLTGCYLWIAAMVLLAITGFYVAFSKKGKSL
jgi:uncharacterized membrane protein HdeD (DUF308 family)